MLKKILLTSSLLPLFAGCGIDPNTLWEVSRLDGTRPNSCYVNGKPPTTTTTQMGVQANVGPWEMYEGPDSKLYLILADKKTVIEGTKGDSYTFQWSVTVVDTDPPPTMITQTDTLSNNVQFKLSGDTLSGTWQTKETHACTGADCGNVTLTPNCEVTSQIRGRRLEADRYKVY
jgi:hypothetical protein